MGFRWDILIALSLRVSLYTNSSRGRQLLGFRQMSRCSRDFLFPRGLYGYCRFPIPAPFIPRNYAESQNLIRKAIWEGGFRS